VEVAPHLEILFALISAAFCALSIDERQRIFRRIAVCGCLAAGALLLTDAIGLAVAAMVVAVGTLFTAVFLTVRWQCTTGWRKSHDLPDE
jgi:ABC-type multidrug transport system permease subunit